MSLMHMCPNCNAEFETGLGRTGGLCRECEQVNNRLQNGGFGLSGEERAATVEFLGVAVKDNAFVVSGRSGGMVWGDDNGFVDYDAIEPIIAVSNTYLGGEE